MKYLKIDNNKGYYWDGNAYQEIDEINKEGIFVLLDAAEKDDFELDPYDEGLIGNRAHQVIYENIYAKFKQFLEDKTIFKNTVDNLYKEAIRKYSADVDNEELEDITDSVLNEETEGAYESDEIDPDDLPF